RLALRHRHREPHGPAAHDPVDPPGLGDDAAHRGPSRRPGLRLARPPVEQAEQATGVSLMQRVRFVMVGGFLGAGKTTTMARLARFYMDRGQRVGLVTNDQAQDLVDTTSLRAQGFAVEEVAGACFCCRFDDLVGKVGLLQEGERPEVILAEPVGSCTDLVATVVQPLRDLYGTRFQVAPYPVLFKPSHGLRILRNDAAAGFSPKAAYIFRKQLEEADAIVINRIDEMTADALAELTAVVAR